MDDARQRARVAALVGKFARKLVDKSPADRVPVVYTALGRLRAAHHRTLRDRKARLAADNFIDNLEDWIWETTRLLEQHEFADPSSQSNGTLSR